MDVIEMDAASDSGVDDIREKIVEVAEYRPAFCRYKVFILDEVHDLSSKAFDALLKTIEEPPNHLIFILATTEFHKVPATIRSRCQKYDFHRGSVQDIVGRLKHVAEAESIEAEPAALHAIARMADGGFRDALTLFEQVCALGEDRLTLDSVYDQLGLINDDALDELLLAIKVGDTTKIVESYDRISRLGRDPEAIVHSLVFRLADLTRALFGVDPGPDGAVNATMHDVGVKLGKETLLALRGHLAATHRTVRDVSLPRLWLEAELLRIASLLKEPVGTPKAATPAAKQEAPQATRPTPSATSPVSDPKLAPAKPPKTAEKEEPVASAVVETLPQEPVDPSNPESVWRRTVADLAKVSKIFSMKLSGTEVVAFDDGVLRISFPTEIDYQTLILEGSKASLRRQAILDKLREVSGQEWRLEYVVRSNGASENGAPSVELPSEGQRLQDVAQQIFGVEKADISE